ncbi:tRNA-specific adenosine deaminase [Marinilactibacillus sp. 15R]|uniref:tRNA-specific adenosine deaminase n=1 Tax=Marinilactibacillus piezotolerans TaxID=258723 RepID=A0A1I4A6J8_9LACT|nr:MULTISPECIES: tRNA adenosine(34) deaminase TadA [Marinilactibacillus]API87903.1 tRNA-specific adenosine deaminase [Marinilactibacillus sp. 15R]SFK51963.1 tRNA-adenosine deaminase [Marinilactibacillus piezotolerans]
MDLKEKEKWMKEAIKEARKAEKKGEVPIGAVVIHKGEIIGRGHNLRETSRNATTHAEMIAIQEANHFLNNWRLENCQLFVTLEPCAMCSGAILLSRIGEVYYGPADIKGGTAGTLMNLLGDERMNHQAYVERGILEEKCRELLTTFFKELRQNKKIEKQRLKLKSEIFPEKSDKAKDSPD